MHHSPWNMADFTFGVLGAVDICFRYDPELNAPGMSSDPKPSSCVDRYGSKPVQFYRSVKGAHKDLDDKLLQMEAIWTKTETQLKVTTRVWGALNDDQRRVQDGLVLKLSGTLQQTLTRIESTLSRKAPADGDSTEAVKLNRIKYALAKEGLDKTIAELEQWHRLYDPTWFLITLITDSLIDKEVLAVRNTTIIGEAHRPLSALSQLRSILHGSKPVHVTLDNTQFDSCKAAAIQYTDGSIRTFSRISSNNSLNTAVPETAPLKPTAR
ncbi:hypothetical protein VTJ49DRAFT_5990 [Mycothermus thermophilus]|uniref:Uncharacterized protein n=1 Tax=Humicola insolens TaxID=85995 RepID=A0ABR3VKV4_HUMIN